MNEDPTIFDRLVEQQDQELAHDGVISPFTRMQLQAYAEGKPLPQVGEHPAFQRATARLLRLLRGPRRPSGDEPDEQDWRFDEEESR